MFEPHATCKYKLKTLGKFFFDLQRLEMGIVGRTVGYFLYLLISIHCNFTAIFFSLELKYLQQTSCSDNKIW